MQKQDKQRLNVPSHIGIIPDGNRRWARARGLPAFKGHEAGLKKFKQILEWCKEFKIKIITFYTFSLENFSRPKEEIKFLMRMLKEEFKAFVKDKHVHKNRIRLNVVGNLELLPGDVRGEAIKAMKATQDYDNYTLNLAVAYGGRAEIADAAKRIALLVKENKLDINKINERTFSEYLYSELPDVDLLIRTSEQRLSGFLPWQSTYAEIVFFPNKLFPDLTKEDFTKAIEEFSNRERRFGK